MSLLIVLTLVATAPAQTAPAPPAERPSVERAKVLYERGQLLEAQEQLQQVLAEIDATKPPRDERNQLGPCLKLLSMTYRDLGKFDEALQTALRRRKLLVELLQTDQRFAPISLAENALLLADILLPRGRTEEAERYVNEALQALRPTAATDPVRTLALKTRLARAAAARDDEAAAERIWKQVAQEAEAALARIDKKQLSVSENGPCTAMLAASRAALGQHQRALSAYARLLDFQTKRGDGRGRVDTLLAMGSLAADAHDYAKARQHFSAALDAQRALAKDSSREADVLSRLGAMLKSQGESAEARRYFYQAAGIYRKALDGKLKDRASPFALIELWKQIAAIEQQAGRLHRAVEANEQLYQLRRKYIGANHPATYAALSDLGTLYGALQNYDEALPKLQDAVAYWRKQVPPAPLPLAQALQGLGVVKLATGSLAEAGALFQESLALREKLLKPDDLRLAYTKSNLASVYLNMGRYSEAAELMLDVKGIYEQRGPAARDGLSNTLLNLAMVYQSQGQLDAAADFCDRAQKVYQQAFGSEAAGNIGFYNALAKLAIRRGQLDRAAPYAAKALELCRRHKLEAEPLAATALHQQATIEFLRKDYDAARGHWQQVLAIQQASGQAAAQVRTINYLARIAALGGKPADAEKLYRQAYSMQLTLRAYPTDLYLTNSNLAEILHDRGEVREAIRLLEQAVAAIEAPRAETIGAEGERAEYFAQFASAFDLLVAWNVEAGNLAEAFRYAERGRNRTFLDQLRLAGVNLLDTLEGDSGKRLRREEESLRTRLGTLQAQAVGAEQAHEPQAALDKLAAQLEQLRKQYANLWTEIRNASPYYRQQLAKGQAIGSLDSVQKHVAGSGSIMLFYYLGQKQSYLLLIGAKGDAQALPLAIPAALAGSMNVEPGPLTRSATVKMVSRYLADLRDRGGGRGLTGIVRSPKGLEAGAEGTSLAEVLLPREVRTLVEKAAPSSVVIVPDGALHQLPFEALLIARDPKPRYLLDAFPPITYAPSATILVNLQERPSPTSGGEPTLLTVANPAYLTDDALKPTAGLAAASRDAFLGLGGKLPLLPGTAIECSKVAEAFDPRHVKRFESAAATEANVRSSIGGRTFVHLAAHGLVDQKYDNLFGAIALTPPAAAGDSAENDGFLSLHEIHSLPLAACQLAVLSACQTNVGPDRPLEAGSTLAQAFLAGGAQRVVCSHWNVDDTSTAETMGIFFRLVADDLKRDGRVHYARALHEAQRRVRAQAKWSSPYYWAPFVLIGPAE